jgi:arsenate reductase (glutaredoxin)
VDLDGLGDDPEAWVQLLVEQPALVERPVVLTGDGRAVIGRPPEAVRDLLV